jgi:ribonuclease R
MERDGQVARNRADGYGTLDKLNLVKGRVIGHPEGYGFVSPLQAGEQDIYLSSRQMRRVFDGDIVLVRISGQDRRGRPEGTLVDVVERKTTELVGRTFARVAFILCAQTIPVSARTYSLPRTS